MPQASSAEQQLVWKERIQKQQESGLSIEKWCQQNQISPHVFHYWKGKFFHKPLQRSSFTELSSKLTGVVSLQACGLSIRLDANCDPEVRKQILALLLSLPC